jgi:TonB family protein
VSGFVDLLLSYLLNSLWQLPLMLVAAFVAARLVQSTGPEAEHRVWVGALLCQAMLPAASLLPWERLRLPWPWHVDPAAVRQASVSVQMGAGTGLGTLLLPSALMNAVALAYAALIVYACARFAWRCARLAHLTRSTQPLHLTPDAALSRECWSRRLGIEPVDIFSSAQIFAPITMGFLRKRLLLPAGMLAGLSRPDVDAAIAHELAHVRRNDFLKNLIYELLSLPVGYHPAFWLARQRMIETREMICDQIAAELPGNHQYAQSLLRLASMLLQGQPLRVPHAIGVFDANTLERRLMKLTETRKPTGRLRSWIALGACVALGVAAASTVVTLRFDVTAAGTDKQTAKNSPPVSVPADKMAEHLLTKVNPKYPPEAKKARIQGKVVLDAVIGKTGNVENLKVVSGPSELQQSALDAVRQWTYKPVLWNGAPIEVESTINVTYTLAK